MALIRKLLNIKGEETRISKFIFLLFLSVGVYSVVTESISLAAFNIRFGADFLPYVYLIFPFLNMAVSLAFMSLLGKMNKRKLFLYYLTVLICVHFLNFFILKGVFHSKIFYSFVMLITLQVNENLIFLTLLILQDVVNIESIKRLLPFGTTCVTLGAILGAFGVNLVSRTINTEMIYITMALLIFIMGYSSNILLKKFRVMEASEEAPEADLVETFKYMKQNSFLFMVIIMSTIVVIFYTASDYLYNITASNIFTSENELVGFISSADTIQNMVALVFQGFIFSRLVTKFGSPNTVKFMLVCMIISVIMLFFGVNFIALLVIGRILYREFVFECNYSIMQILYQPVNSHFKETILIITEVAAGLIGCLIGAGLSLMHSNGLVSTFGLTAIIIVISALTLLIWHAKQNGFIKVIENTMNLASELDIKKLFGSVGINKLLNYLSQKINGGKTLDILFSLDFIRKIDSDEKLPLIKTAFIKGNIEARFKIIDMVINKQASPNVLLQVKDLLDHNTMTYMIKSAVFNYNFISASGILQLLKSKKTVIDNSYLDDYTLFIYEYILEEKPKSYENLLNLMFSKDSSDSYKLMLEIMTNFIGIEDTINKKYLDNFTVRLEYNQSIVKDMVCLCCYYDSKTSDYFYLKEIVSSLCSLELLEKTLKFYKPYEIIENLKNQSTIISKAFILYAARFLSTEELKTYYSLCSETLEMLYSILAEKAKIEKYNHQLKSIVLEELNDITLSIKVVIVDFILIYHGFSPIKNLAVNLSDKSKAEMVYEILKNTLPNKAYNFLIPVLTEEIRNISTTQDYSKLSFSKRNSRLEKLYMALDGIYENSEFEDEFNKIAVLKKVPMFKELNYEMLYSILQISSSKNVDKNELIVKKGDKGKAFYVLLSGEAIVNLDTSSKPIAILNKGDIIGELAAIDEGVRTADVITSKPSILLEFNSDDLLNLLNKSGEVAFTIIKTLSKRLSNMLEKG